ncbi:tagatose-1,6-bisphosphate aldolase non-catalytic subunit AgaZ/GatZ [Gluconobacter cerinus]|nr:tagatose-1,6-bisphosphate aldolase non-catalytic subunit AgaZ/GatZ [Gluconobacter cerinus]
MGCPAATLVDLGPTNNWPHMVDSTVVRAHSQAAGAEIKLIRRLLVDHVVTLRAKSMLDMALRDALWALSLLEDRSRTTKPQIP